MNWLFWKECRQNRVIIIALLAVLVVPQLFGLYGMWNDWRWMSKRAYPWHLIHEGWLRILFGASYVSLIISQIALALIGGNVIAGERADRSAEFQVYLPLTRKKIFAAKLLLALAIAIVIWTINPLILWSTFASASPGSERPDLPKFILLIATTGLVFFCVAWFFSSSSATPRSRSPAGLVSPLIIWLLIMYGAYLAQGEHWKAGTEETLKTCYLGISLPLPCPASLLAPGFTCGAFEA